MYAPFVECSTDLQGYLHEVSLRGSEYVHRGHDFGFRQLPDVQLVYVLHTFHIADGSVNFLK